MADDERRHTLVEARAALRREECAFNGHSWSVVETAARPVAIVCPNCGKRYAVVEDAAR